MIHSLSTIEGRNNRSEFNSRSSWILIYNSSKGLTDDPERNDLGAIQVILDNTLWFTDYRLLVTSKHNSSNAVQYADVIFHGYYL